MVQGFLRKIGLTALSILLLIGSVISFPIFTAYAATDEDYEYEDLYDGTAKITGYAGLIGGNVDIPGSVGGGLIVVEIGLDAFRSKQLTSVTIPDSVTTIGQGVGRPSDSLIIGIMIFTCN